MNPNAIWDDKTQAVILQFTYIQCDLVISPTIPHVAIENATKRG